MGGGKKYAKTFQGTSKDLTIFSGKTLVACGPGEERAAKGQDNLITPTQTKIPISGLEKNPFE